MRITKDIRRLAFQTLYQLDARGGEHRDEVRAGQAGGWRLEAGGEGPSAGAAPALDDKSLDAAWALAEGAWEHRRFADEELAALAPDWPTSRLAAVDRAILRLAHFEMSPPAAGEPPRPFAPTPPKVVVNDAVNLAKEFSTDRAPAFINGLLDKVLRRVLAAIGGEEAAGEAHLGGEGADLAAEPVVEAPREAAPAAGEGHRPS